MPTKITVKTNGSIHVEGDIELYDIEGNIKITGYVMDVEATKFWQSLGFSFISFQNSIYGDIEKTEIINKTFGEQLFNSS